MSILTERLARLGPLSLRLLETNGFSKQSRKCEEECAELTLALMHYADGRATVAQVREEIADVLITALTMARALGEEEVIEMIDYKSRRTEFLLPPVRE